MTDLMECAVHVTDDGTSLNYRDDDLRDPWARTADANVLMHHGFGKSLEWWTPVTSRLAHKHRVVRWDVRGCGRSSTPAADADWSVARLIRDAISIADHVGCERFDWVGFESGGIVGMAVAAAHPARVRSLTIVNTPPGSWMTTGQMGTLTSGAYATSREAIDAMGMDAYADVVYPLGMDVTLASPEMQAWGRASMARTPASVAKELLNTFEHTDISTLPEQVTVPTLIIAGANHRTGAEAPGQEDLRRRIPGARAVVMVPGVAAGVHLLAPDFCAAAIERFLGSDAHDA